jgi:hypothetical protein
MSSFSTSAGASCFGSWSKVPLALLAAELVFDNMRTPSCRRRIEQRAPSELVAPSCDADGAAQGGAARPFAQGASAAELDAISITTCPICGVPWLSAVSGEDLGLPADGGPGGGDGMLA